jgi:hypothetical protein
LIVEVDAGIAIETNYCFLNSSSLSKVKSMLQKEQMERIRSNSFSVPSFLLLQEREHIQCHDDDDKDFTFAQRLAAFSSPHLHMNIFPDDESL